MATIDEIARRANVSKTTVSFVINQRPGVSEETVASVRRIMAEMDYVPSALAQRLASRKSKTIALVMLPYPHVFSDLRHGLALDAVYETLEAAGYSLVLATSSARFIDENRYQSLLRSGQVDGMLVLEPTLDQSYLAKLASEDAPVVIVNSDGEDLGLDYVRTDEIAVGQIAADHLLHLGHRRFGFVVGSSNHASARDRATGFLDVLEQAGHHLDGEQIYYGAFETSHWSGHEGCVRILSQHPETTAIFCSNDTMAHGAIEAAKDAGRRVPDDLSIIGVDDSRSAMYSSPALTTIRQPSFDVAKQATQILLDRLTGKDPKQRRNVGRALPPTLVERDSTAPAPHG